MCTRVLSLLIRPAVVSCPSRIVAAVALMVGGDVSARGARS
jgi:hypothetical protein